MPRFIPRLPFLTRDRTRPAGSAGARSGADDGTPPADADPAAADFEELGPPPILRPAAIFRQLLWDPNELDPVWARPRAATAATVPDPPGAPAAVDAAVDALAAAGVALTDPPADAPQAARRTRRPKVEGAPTPSPTKPRRAATSKPRAGKR